MARLPPGGLSISAWCALKDWKKWGANLEGPEADFLRDGIFELRVGLQHMNYRILYFFHGNVAAVISHGIIKEDRIPPKEIEKAIARKRNFAANPALHTYMEDES